MVSPAVHANGVAARRVDANRADNRAIRDTRGRWSVRRECLDHVIIFTAAGLQRILKECVEYYNDVSYCPTSLCA